MGALFIGVRVALAATLGVAAGIGGYTFLYAQGASYLTDDPAACANCHVMRDQHDGWVKSSHRKAAVCNDCHTPAGLVARYATKAKNGFWHSFAFTSGRFAEPITIKIHNRDVVEARCRACHAAVVDAIDGPHDGEAPLACVRCHAEVGHP